MIIKEIQKRGIFNISQDKEAEYELSGRIKSLKVERKTGTMQWVALPFFVVGDLLILVDPIAAIPFFLITIPINLSNRDPLIATVAFETVLKRNGEVIWEGTLIKKQDEKMWTAFKGRNKSSDICASLLDRSITISVRKMLKDIYEEI